MPLIRPVCALVAVLSVVAAAGCDDENITLTQPDTSVNGSVTVRARGYPGDAALPHTSYQLVGTGVSGVSDSAGVITVTNLAAGSHALRLSAPGFASTLYTFTISSAVVHDQRDVPLLAKTSAMTLAVYTADGAPARNAAITLDRWMFPTESASYYEPFEFAVDDPTVPTTAQTDANGEVTLTNLPATGVWLSVPAFDANGDGVVDHSFTSFLVTFIPSATVRATLVLPPLSHVGILSSNLTQYGTYPLSDSLVYFVFTDAMDTTAAATHLGYNQGFPYYDTPIPTRWTSPVRLEADLPGSLLLAGSIYTLHMNVRSVTGASYAATYTFIWAPPLTGSISP